jgi:hypothetical protein
LIFSTSLFSSASFETVTPHIFIVIFPAPHQIDLFVAILHIVEGVKSSGHFSPTRYVFPAETVHHNALAQETLSTAHHTAFEIFSFTLIIELKTHFIQFSALFAKLTTHCIFSVIKSHIYVKVETKASCIALKIFIIDCFIIESNSGIFCAKITNCAVTHPKAHHI